MSSKGFSYPSINLSVMITAVIAEKVIFSFGWSFFTTVGLDLRAGQCMKFGSLLGCGVGTVEGLLFPVAHA